ncbi:hypothetical protein Tco_0164768 [Tanacetum coccineum]
MIEQNNYISVSQKNCISNDNEGRMIERNFVEIQGAFLVKIQDNTFNGAIRENVFEHISAASEWFKKDCIGSVTTWDNLVENFVQNLYQHSNHNEEIEEDNDPDSITDIFKIDGNLFDFETPLCEAFNNFNYLLKIDKDLFTFDIQGTGTHEECELNNPVTKDLEETCSDIDGFCNNGELPGMVRVGSMTYFQDHKCFGNFYELDYNVLVKLQECWWKINADEVAPFTRSEGYGQRSYANIKTEKDNQGHEEQGNDPTLEQPVCKIRRFEMMKYSFNSDEEYIAIKESEYLNNSKDNLDAYRELLRIIDEG